MPFKNRWLIEGLLTTLSPLHIGNGSTTVREELKDGNDFVEIEAVSTDANGRAFISGSTMKGNIRSWLKFSNGDIGTIEEIFGSEDTKKKTAVGGKAEFWNAYADNIPTGTFKHFPSYWDPSRFTGVTASVAIDRYTRTAREHGLFYREFVPPGVSFKFVIAGQDMEDKEIILLLRALEIGFGFDSQITIGASTSNGWGRLNWELIELRKLECKHVRDWIDKGCQSIGYLSLQPISKTEKIELLAKAHELAVTPENSLLSFEVSLQFDSLFLVNDPSQIMDDSPDHMPTKDTKGNVSLPAESFRGAFRAQAERIIRTMGMNACNISKSCAAIKKIDEKNRLCLACQIFGASGWKTAVQVSDFSLTEPVEEIVQEFVAIDRFTGGGADKHKFNAQAAVKPVFKGTISVNRTRIKDWGLGLIALTLRDLIEGDITFGFGAAKGYGRCTARISINPEMKTYLNQCIQEFRMKVNDEQEVTHV